MPGPEERYASVQVPLTRKKNSVAANHSRDWGTPRIDATLRSGGGAALDELRRDLRDWRWMGILLPASAGCGLRDLHMVYDLPHSLVVPEAVPLAVKLAEVPRTMPDVRLAVVTTILTVGQRVLNLVSVGMTRRSCFWLIGAFIAFLWS